MATKKEILESLQVSGEVHRKKKTDAWVNAFDAYIKDTNDSVSLGCSKCYDKVLRWLRK